ncbi:hypothetical protein DQ04_07401050 [Trypanosoma grayi]|uniref:hypothetical protein n=1 Tax=Trypanosoma grayi TaxID=71804 RepID=UPI0004F4929B|nr:hypothetical protein DQ04_07401050 [Trypanosoma grayi]KEG08350.1 hypothetical protein DQ04_07401050 [Trypanosoma grayi]
MDDDNEYDSYSDTVAEARRLHRRIPTNNNGNYRRQLAAFLARNTSAFHVPLASLVLNVFHVTADADMGTAVEERCVTSARVEAYCRRGELQWFTVGESKRHRSLLESK